MPQHSIVLEYDAQGRFVQLVDDPRKSAEDQRKEFALLKGGHTPPPDGVHKLVRVTFDGTLAQNGVEIWIAPAAATQPKPITKKDKSK